MRYTVTYKEPSGLATDKPLYYKIEADNVWDLGAKLLKTKSEAVITRMEIEFPEVGQIGDTSMGVRPK